jgi:uncharacterized protein YcaQ
LKLFVYAGKIVDAMRDAWTDERLDDLNQRVAEMGRRMDNGFNQAHEDIRALRGDTKSEFIAVRAEIASLHRLMVQLTGGVIATIVATEIASRL